MDKIEQYFPDVALVFFALLSGYSTQKDISTQIWKILSTEAILGNSLPYGYIYELESTGVIRCANPKVDRDAMKAWWSSTFSTYDKSRFTPKNYDDEALNIKIIEEILSKHTNFQNLIDLGFDGAMPTFIGGIKYEIEILEQAKLKKVIHDYLISYTEDGLKSNSASEPVSWDVQKKTLLAVLAGKSNNYNQEITITQSDLAAADKSLHLRFLETLLTASALNYLHINYLSIDYRADGFRSLLNGSHKGELFARVTIDDATINNSKVIRQKVAKPKPASPIKLEPEYYDKNTGRLHIPGIGNVYVSNKGSAFRPPDKTTNLKKGKMYDQCWLMYCVFKNVNTLNNGVSFNTITSVNTAYSQGISKRKIKNIVYQINLKSSEQTGIESLIKISHDKVFINNSYL